MYEEILSEIGLTKSEIATYLALLDIGSSTTGPIIKKASIASGKAYLVLDGLIKKGLVTYSIKTGTKYYQAKDPERLLDYLKEKESDLKEKEKQLMSIIPKLKKQHDEKKYETKSEVFEGTKGFKTFFEFCLRSLEKGEVVEIMGVPRGANERFEPYLMDWNKRREKKGVIMHILYNHNVRDYGKRREKLPLTKVKYMKQEIETPSWLFIFKDYVVTLNVHGDPICFLIKNKESAESYHRYFEIIWKQADKH